MKSRQSILGLGLVWMVALSFTACVMSPKKFDTHNEGEWGGKIRLINTKTSDSLVARIKVRVQDQKYFRLDVVSALGDPWLSMLMKDQGIEALVPSEKKVIRGPANKSMMNELVQVPLDPKVLYDIMFDRAFANKDWTCVKTKAGVLESCFDSKRTVEVNWRNREGKNRTIDIKSKSASVQMLLNDFDARVSSHEKAQKIAVPSSYKVVNKGK
jgi:hypothetical protein